LTARQARREAAPYAGLLALAIVGVCGIAPLAGQSISPELQKILSQPLSAVALARLVPHAATPAAASRLTGALSDPRPEIRAAAARVLFVTGSTHAANNLAAAVDIETDPDAAFEEGRALAHLARPEHDARIVDAWRRTGAFQLPLALASARGPAAIDFLPTLRMPQAREIPLSAYIRLASRGDGALLASIAMGAVKDTDAKLLAAALEAARAVDAAVPDGVLVSALQAANSKLGTETIDHYLRGWAGDDVRPRMSETLQPAVLAFVASNPGTDPGSTFTHELAARGAGREPRSDEAWMALLTDPTARLGTYGRLPSVRALLTPQETETLNRTYKIPPSLFEENFPPRDKARDTSLPALRTATGYPNGFLETILSGTGCSPTQGGGLAEVTYRPSGSVARIALSDSNVPRRCAEAVRLLLMTYTPEPNRTVADNQRDLLMVPLLKDYIACQADMRGAAQSEPEKQPGRTITPPKKIRDVRPVFPRSAQVDRVGGVVRVESRITKSGCVSWAVVTGSVDPRLDWAAVVAVLQWRFTPTLLGDVPAEVTMNVTVNFDLGR
jgi:TonB family protein